MDFKQLLETYLNDDKGIIQVFFLLLFVWFGFFGFVFLFLFLGFLTLKYFRWQYKLTVNKNVLMASLK